MWAVAHTSVLLFGVLSVMLAGFAHGITQEEINYMARNLEVTYTVNNNVDQEAMLLTINLRNGGSQNMAGQGWSLYFSNIRVLQPAEMLKDGGTYITRDGVLLGDSNLKLFHVNGVLFRIDPTPDFTPLAKGQEITLPLEAQHWEVARSDIMPNWYVVGNNTEPRIVDSTSGQSLDFVADFTDPKQYKRSSADLYKPFTPEDRYNMFSIIEDNPQDRNRIVPKVVLSNFEMEKMSISGGDWAVVAPAELEFSGKYLAEKLGLIFIPTTGDVPSSRFIELKVDPSTGNSDTCNGNEETYTIYVDTDAEKVTITGRKPAGVLHGVQSLRALANHGSGSIHKGLVEDCPRFGYRGMHVDTARNFFPKATILELLDLMSMYKLSTFHFHLTDDEGWRLEIPGLPELTEIGARRCHDLTGDHCIMPQLGAPPNGGGSGSGYYSVADYEEILRYAQDRHITVIPEFDMPGHAHAAINAMLSRERKTGDATYRLVDPDDTSRYLSVQTFIDNAMNPCINSTYVFVEKVLDEVVKMHETIQPLKVFNFGGDEVAHTAWVNSTACASLMNLEKRDIKKLFAMRVSQLAKARNMALAGWEDGLMYDGGQNQPFNISDLDTTEVHAYAWNNIWEWGSGSRAYRLANAGYKAIISHATNLYFDHPHEPDPEERGYYWATRFTNTKKTFGFMPDTVYDNIDFDLNGNPITKEEICSDESNCPPLEDVGNILGIQGHLWSETVRTSQQFEDMVFPRFLALAERAWHKAPWETETNAASRDAARDRDWTEFANLLGHKELKRLDDMDINYHILQPGAMLEGTTLKVRAEFPGMPIAVSEDDGVTWCQVTKEIQVTPGSTVQFVTKSADGRRQSRTSTLPIPDSTNSAANGKPIHSFFLMLAAILTWFSKVIHI